MHAQRFSCALKKDYLDPVPEPNAAIILLLQDLQYKTADNAKT